MKHVLLSISFFLTSLAMAGEVRIGIIGSDTSHVGAFTKVINDPTDKNHVPGGKVVAIYKSGSKDIESSWSRVERYAEDVRKKYGVKYADTIEALCEQVDAVLLESVDGRPHLEQAKPVIKAGKRMFVDKPVAGTLRDAIELYKLAKANNVPIFTSSSYRFYDSMVALKQAKIGKLRGAISYGPCSLEPHHPDFFWYGIHPVEGLFTVMGTGCETVVRTATTDTDVTTGTWADGKTGVFYALRVGPMPHKVIAFGTEAVAEQKEGNDSYAPLVVEIMKFFQTGLVPIAPEESLEIYAFMEAADESKRQGGVPVKISEIMAKNGGAGMLKATP